MAEKKKPPNDGGERFWQAVALVGAVASVAGLIISLIK